MHFDSTGSARLRLSLALVIMLVPSAPAVADGKAIDWPAYGRDLHGTRYLPAETITRENVQGMEHAWTYRTGEVRPEFKTRKPTSFQATPIMVDGTLYLATPLGRVIALAPSSGEEKWVFDPRIRRDITYGDFANRGLSTWLDPTAEAGARCSRRLYVATAQSQLIALDAATGTPCKDFGKKGVVNLLDGLRIAPFEAEAYSMTSPPVVANGLVVVGSSIADNSRPNPASGEIRAFNARTGAQEWSWDPIPQNPDDPAYPEWKGEMAHQTGGANAWSALSADPERDIVYVPTTSPSPDYYGVLRLGQNRYANSIVALRMSTGKRIWDFQTVHHDLWDYDNASPPALVTIRQDEAEVPAVLQATKTGMLFILNRETGEPVFPVEERAVPASQIPDEEAWPTQPFTTSPPPLSPHQFDIADTWGPTEEDREACRGVIEGLRYDGVFTPPDTRGILQIPSSIGGAHWGGVAVDPVRQVAVVPVNRIAWMMQLIPRDEFDRDKYAARDHGLGHDYEYNMMRGTPYVMRRRMLTGPSGLPCTPPPWGSLVAVDLASGTIRWDVPLGSVKRAVPPEAVDGIQEQWGSPNLGGPIVTAGGVVFIGAALDRWLKAYDIETGQLLWRGALPESARATPMSYQLESGEQYVVVAVGGGDMFGSGDHLVAFRLPPND